MLHAGAAFAGAGAARALPESPRFLLRSKRNQTLINDTLGTFAVSVSSSSEDFRQEYSSQTTEYPELSKHISLHSVALAGVWFCLSFGSYGVLVWNNIIFTNLGLKNPYMISLLFCLADVPGNLISILLVTKIGQQMFLAISMSCVMVFAVVLAVLARIAPYHANDSHQTAVLVLTACLFEASVASWNLLDASSAEFFDGALQVIGMGILSALGRTGSLISQVVNAELEDDIFTLLVIASATLTAGTVSAWCLVLPSRSKVLRTGNAY